MSESKKRQLNIASGIWLVALLLAILVLASAVLAGSFVRRYVAGEKNVISVMIDGDAIKDAYDDPDYPAGALPDYENSGAKWETQTSVDLFKNTYTDENGNVTVESAIGDKVIAPGTTNDYTFTLKNTGNISLDFSLKLDGVFTISDKHLPFYVRLYSDGRWIVGNETDWVHVDMLDVVEEKKTLLPDETAEYTFEWQWPYDADDESQKLVDDLNDTLISFDENDTELGTTVDISASFTLDITTTAVITPGAVAVYGDGTKVLGEFILVLAMAALVLGSGIWLIILFFFRRIYFAAFISPSLKANAKLDGKEMEIINTHVAYPKVKFGKHVFDVSDNTCEFRIKRGKVESGVELNFEEDIPVVKVDRSIRALELHFLRHFHNDKYATIETDNWAAIDKKHNVYTESGMTPPNEEDNTNRTPGGLFVDEKGRFSVDEA